MTLSARTRVHRALPLHPTPVLLVVLGLLAGLLALAPAATASDPTTITLGGPSSGAAGEEVRLTVTLSSSTTAGEQPLAAPVRITAPGDAGPREVARVTTGADGTATATVVLAGDEADNRFTAVYDGDGTRAPSTSAELVVALEDAPPALDLRAPASGLARRTVALTAALTGTDAAGREVVLERDAGDGWQPVARATTQTDGRVSWTTRLPARAGTVTYRAVLTTGPGEQPVTSATRRVVVRRHASVVTLTGPTSVVDERALVLRVRARTADGEALPRAAFVLQHTTDGTWRTLARGRTDTRGRDSLTVAPRVDTRYRVRLARGPWWSRRTSAVHRVDNVPPGEPVVLPAGAPAPRITLPPQPRATGDGPRVVATPVPDGVWARMQGRSWHQGCLPRTSLRLVRVNYWGFDGYRHRGELMVAASHVGDYTRALRRLYDARVPIRAMYLVDRFGWSRRLRGADDYASMAADNTSAFNCRDVVGRPGVRSPHASGRAWDVNPWENPYAASHGWVPNRWWGGRSHPRVAWRSGAHPVVRILRGAGFRWTYGTRDAHHFDA